MLYSRIVGVYEALSATTKKLEKVAILAAFLPSLKGHEDFLYLLRARVFADYDSRELGVSTQLIIKAIARAGGVGVETVTEAFKKKGDLGDVASDILVKTKQQGLFATPLTVEYVVSHLRKLPEITGENAVDKKLALISELLTSASTDEAVFLVRTILGDLRIGVADGVVIDSIVSAFFSGDKDMIERVQRAYDFVTDYAEVLRLAFRGKDAFSHIALLPGRALNPMLAVKVTDIDEAFDVCGKPAALEHKYDGFRVIVTCDGKDIRLFTRRLEDVTKQFPDVVTSVRQFVTATTFVFDAEAVGYDLKTGRYLPFEAISQRIRRKYSIDELAKAMPVELNVFDVLYLDGQVTAELPFFERRKILTGVIREEAQKLKLATQIVTDDITAAERFYSAALKIGEEGIMIKNLKAPYQPGRYVGFMAKLKPDAADLDVVIVGGEYGTGKRAGGLTSFIVAVRDGDDFVEIGRVSSGLKEKAEEGMTYEELDALLQPLILSGKDNSVRVTPKIVVSVTYQNIQPSPTYSSGFALRFPRITHVRPERGLHDIATLDDVKNEAAKASRKLAKKKG
jgi:DNA ligase 1